MGCHDKIEARQELKPISAEAERSELGQKLLVLREKIKNYDLDSKKLGKTERDKLVEQLIKLNSSFNQILASQDSVDRNVHYQTTLSIWKYINANF